MPNLRRSKELCWLLLALGILGSVLPLLLVSGIPFGHDTSFHMSRIASLSEALKNGVILPGVYPEYFNGFGYGAGLFYPDVFLLIPAAFIVMGLSGVTAYKIYLILITAAMGLSMYLCAGRVSGSRWCGLFSALIYLLCSYHTTDLYIRSTVGELAAFVFFPMIVAGLWEILENHGDELILGLGFGGMILSHVLSAILAFFLCLALCLCMLKKIMADRDIILMLLKAAGLALLVSAFFWLPMVEQLVTAPVWGDTGLLGDISGWAVNPLQMILALPSADFGNQYAPPPGLGILLIVFGVWGIIQDHKPGFQFFLLLIGFISLWAVSALFPWVLIGRWFSTLQFPWRFYLIVSVIFSFYSGEIIKNGIRHKQQLFAVCALCFAAASFAVNVSAIYATRTLVQENPYPTFAAGCEYLPRDMHYDTLLTATADPSPAMTRWGYNHYSVTIHQAGAVTLPLIYYPGYTATLDGKPVAVSKNDQGFVQIDSSSEGTLNICYTGTPLRQWSLASIWVVYPGVILLIIWKKRQKRKKERVDPS
jgi:uncharacterized membrane protein